MNSIDKWGRYNPVWHFVHWFANLGQPKKRSPRQIRWFKTGKDLAAIEVYYVPQHPSSELARTLSEK